MTFFAGNAKNILIKKQVDKDTPIADFTGAINLRVYEWGKDPVRTIAELAESDSSTQQSQSHVTAVAPQITFGVYGRPSELDFLAEALLGADDDTGSGAVTRHTATPTTDTPYYSILEVLPYGTVRYDGARCVEAEFKATDSGTTELQVTGIIWIPLGVTLDVAAPTPLPAVADELPFIFAEAAVKYAGVHPGTTCDIDWKITRNAARAQGDMGFRAIDVVNGKLQTDGSFTRYTADETAMKTVDTGDPAGTTPTSAIYRESASVLFSRGAGADERSFGIAAPEISFETRQEALDLNGQPFKEVLGFRTQPQATLADHIALVTVNAKATP
jgi:hypothetical protein